MRPGRFAVVHNGLDPERVVENTGGAAVWLRDELGLPRTTMVVGTVGRLATEKDHDTFLRAVARARTDRPELHAVIAGDGALRASLESRAGELGLDGHVHFLGARKDSRRIIAALDLFVLASRIEGFPNVLLEAAFLGVPAIATAVGGAADVLTLEDLAWAGDSERLGRMIVARLGALDQARFHAAAVRRRALERFTAERSARRWLTLYANLLEREGAPR
jgi:glycosyltransferase involved in cell wall biosynthesis